MHHEVLPESFAPKDQARAEAPQAHQNRVTEKLHPDFEIRLYCRGKMTKTIQEVLHLYYTSAFRFSDCSTR